MIESALAAESESLSMSDGGLSRETIVMATGELKIYRPDHPDLARAAHYESSDLDYFEDILREILQDLAERQDGLVAPANEAATRVRLAAGLFKCAEEGERDRVRLKQRTLATIDPSGARPSPDAH